ncbi:MAG: co-chaperone DjlA [Gammaproteobacteria bacterium]|nr:co-chaperone DjlA [Gammaproteobacteria bacterium]
MSYWGKTIGAVFGYLIGGAVGALLGLLIGHLFDKGLQGKQHLKFTRLTPELLAQIRGEFFTATFAVMGYIATIEERPAEDRIKLVKHIMDRMAIKEDRRGDALRLFNEGQKPEFPLQTIIGQFYVACKTEPGLLEIFMEIQLYAAHYFGKIHPLVKQTLLTMCYQLDMGNGDYNRIERMVKAEYQSPTPSPNSKSNSKKPRVWRGKSAGLEDAYAMLNTTPDASDEEVKAAYRRLTSKHHPDKLMANGTSEEVLKLAEEKTRLIRAAYERIREVRDF